MCNSWIFLFEENMFCLEIKIFVILWNLQTSKFLMSSQALLDNGSYIYAYFFWILSAIKMKFSLIVCCMANITNMSLAECWRLETHSRLSKIWPFLMIDIYHFQLSLIDLFKKNETLESWYNWLLSNWGRFLNGKGPGN